MAERTAYRVRVRKVVRAPRERVFDAWVREEDIRVWWPPEHMTAGAIETDARAGGRYALGLVPPEGEEFAAVGEYRAVDRPSRLEFTWTWTGSPLETVVVVEFNEVEEGTEVVLTHTGFPEQEVRDQHEDGWEKCLDRMAERLG